MSLKEANKTLAQILAPVSTEIQTLDRRLIEEISPSSRALCSILAEIFKAGGKRLRPCISFLIYKLVCKSSSLPAHHTPEQLEKIYLISEISELIHTASLVHDDIIDNSKLRRGKPTASSKWDNAIAVISGDFMFARAAVNLGKLGNTEIVSIYASVLEDLCDGEIRQVEMKYNTDLHWDYYFNKTYKKTASLFEASALAVAVAMDLKPSDREALALYGKNLGMAFQVIDDILDYSADEQTLGKPAASDLREGQVTLPVLYAIEELQAIDTISAKQFTDMIQSLASLGPVEQDAVMKSILEIFHSTNALSRSNAKARAYINEAIDSLKNFAETESKSSLIDLAEFVLTRTN